MSGSRLARRAADHAGHVINAKTYIQQTVNKNITGTSGVHDYQGTVPPG